MRKDWRRELAAGGAAAAAAMPDEVEIAALGGCPPALSVPAGSGWWRSGFRAALRCAGWVECPDGMWRPVAPDG